jgi:hypothetical protein
MYVVNGSVFGRRRNNAMRRKNAHKDKQRFIIHAVDGGDGWRVSVYTTVYSSNDQRASLLGRGQHAWSDFRRRSESKITKPSRP